MGAHRIKTGRRTIDVTNLDKVLFSRSGLTKRELIDYYRRIADTALPHYRDRPLTMQRFPDGIEAGGFFQKDAPDYFPAWIDRVELDKEGGTTTYLVANEAATLVYIANQGCITPHLGLTRHDKPDKPDRLIFDLDPSDDDFGKVCEAATALKALFDSLRMASFVQTTGSRGLHVLVPLDRSCGFDEVREFARALAEHLADRNPDTLTVEQRKRERGDRVYLDYVRNAYGQTAVAPYAVRPIDGGPVATPLRWAEVKAHDLGPQKYTVRNIFRRLGQIDDPWVAIARRACSIEAARRRFAKLT